MDLNGDCIDIHRMYMAIVRYLCTYLCTIHGQSCTSNEAHVIPVKRRPLRSVNVREWVLVPLRETYPTHKKCMDCRPCNVSLHLMFLKVNVIHYGSKHIQSIRVISMATHWEDTQNPPKYSQLHGWIRRDLHLCSKISWKNQRILYIARWFESQPRFRRTFEAGERKNMENHQLKVKSPLVLVVYSWDDH